MEGERLWGLADFGAQKLKCALSGARSLCALDGPGQMG
jgi:hypothetical protein